jgi:hypothetical protein
LILHFLLSFPTWLFSPTLLCSNSIDCLPRTVSQFGSVDLPGILQLGLLLQLGTGYSPANFGFLLFQFVFIFSQYSNSFHSANILLSSNFKIIFLIFFFLLLFIYFSFFLLFLFVFILFSYFSIFLFLVLI